MDRFWEQVDEKYLERVEADTDHVPLRPTKVGNATRAEARKDDIKRYRKKIETAKRRKKMLKKFKKKSRIGHALAKLDKKIRFYKDLINKTRRVGQYSYDPIYSDTRELIITLYDAMSITDMADQCGCSRSVLHLLRGKHYREVSKDKVHHIYEILSRLKRRTDGIL